VQRFFANHRPMKRTDCDAPHHTPRGCDVEQAGEEWEDGHFVARCKRHGAWRGVARLSGIVIL
jgi:hypothetical protein